MTMLHAKLAEKIINDYGTILGKVSGELYSPESILPYGKETIKDAIKTALSNGSNTDTAVLVKGYSELAKFVDESWTEEINYCKEISDFMADNAKNDNTIITEGINAILARSKNRERRINTLGEIVEREQLRLLDEICNFVVDSKKI